MQQSGCPGCIQLELAHQMGIRKLQGAQQVSPYGNIDL